VPTNLRCLGGRELSHREQVVRDADLAYVVKKRRGLNPPDGFVVQVKLAGDRAGHPGDLVGMILCGSISGVDCGRKRPHGGHRVEPLEPCDPVAGREVRDAFRVVEDDCSPSGTLGVEERTIREAQQGVRVPGMDWVYRDSGRERHLPRAPSAFNANCIEDSPRQHQGIQRVVPGSDQAEFIRPETGSSATRRASCLEHGTDLGKKPVARELAVDSVEQLKVVHIECDHCDRLAIALSLSDLLLKTLVEEASIEQAGQRIGHGAMEQDPVIHGDDHASGQRDQRDQAERGHIHHERLRRWSCSEGQHREYGNSEDRHQRHQRTAPPIRT